jgi:hypothetical protein
MDCIFTDDEIEWMQSVTINGRREVLTSEAVENPMPSLLRAGVIQEKSGKLIVAAKYKQLFRVEQSPRKTKPEPEPEPKQVAKNTRIVGFGKIVSKVTFLESDIGELDDVLRSCMVYDCVYNKIVENICRGLETKDFSEAVECGNVARKVFEMEVERFQANHIAQLYLHATSRAQQLQVRLMRLANRERRVFDEVRVRPGDDIRSVVFSGPTDSVVAAVTMYTYSTNLAHRYAKMVLSERAHKKDQAKKLYADALTEAMEWLD